MAECELSDFLPVRIVLIRFSVFVIERSVSGYEISKKKLFFRSNMPLFKKQIFKYRKGLSSHSKVLFLAYSLYDRCCSSIPMLQRQDRPVLVSKHRYVGSCTYKERSLHRSYTGNFRTLLLIIYMYTYCLCIK